MNVRPRKLSNYTLINTKKVIPTLLTRSIDDGRTTGSPPSSEKLSYCRVYSAKANLLLLCSNSTKIVECFTEKREKY